MSYNFPILLCNLPEIEKKEKLGQILIKENILAANEGEGKSSV
jgi:hypothetical protein